MSKIILGPMRRSGIQFLAEQRCSEASIARQLKISRYAVQHNLKKFAETALVGHRPGSGRKRGTTAREDKELTRASLKNRRKVSSELAADLSSSRAIAISARNVRRRLLAAVLKACKARKKPWLSAKNLKARYDRAKKHEH